MRAFLSHSRKDQNIVNNIFKICKRVSIEPDIAEFEDIETGKLSAEEIRKMIDRSELFLLFLTENVVKTIYTQNWVTFELGCAYAQKREKKKSIYVFEPFSQIHFPIPYLDYYVLIDPDSNPHWNNIQALFNEEVDFQKYTSSINPFTKAIVTYFRLQSRLKGHPLKGPSESYGHAIKHNECGAQYTLLSLPEKWNCPTCRKPTNWMPS